MKKTPGSQNTWIPAAIIVVAVVAAFWPAFSGEFIWDDDSILTQNPLIPRALHLIWFSSQPVDYFPLTYTSLWLEWRIWGANPLGYHITNVILHAASCLVLWRTFERLKVPGAWLAALLFAVHPVNVESVAWIAERKNVLAMFFYALTALFFVKFAQTRRKPFYLVSIVAFLLSLLAKPAAVAWPVVAYGILYFVHKDRPEKENTKKHIVLVLPFVALSLVLSIVAIWFQAHRAIGTDVIAHHDFVTRMLVASAACWFYLAKAFVPVSLMFVYPEWSIGSHSVLAYVPAFALAVTFAILWMFRKTWAKPILVVMAYFLLLLAPVLGFVTVYFQRYSYVADHWQYFALPSVVVLLALALVKLRAHRVVGPVLVVAFALAAYSHTKLFHDSETLWSETLEKNPKSWLAMNNLGFCRQNSGRVDDAIALYRRSLALNPEQPEAHNNFGFALMQSGKLDDAIEHFQAAIHIDPHYSPAHYDLATAYQSAGKFDEAIAEYREALRWKSDYVTAANNLACLLALRGQRTEAVTCLREVVALEPDYADALMNLGTLLNEDHKSAEALPLLKRAAALAPDVPDTRSNLGHCLFALKQLSEAQAQFLAALQLKQDHTQALYGLANCLKANGKTEEALKLYEQVIKLNPEHAESHYQLGILFSASGNPAAAAGHLREAIRLKPDWVEALNNMAWLLATDERCPPVDRAEAVRWAQHAVDLTHASDANSLDTLGAAWARNEVFGKALEAAQPALRLATESGQTNLAKEINLRIALYRNQKPYNARGSL